MLTRNTVEQNSLHPPKATAGTTESQIPETTEHQELSRRLNSGGCANCGASHLAITSKAHRQTCDIGVIDCAAGYFHHYPRQAPGWAK